MSNKYVYFGPMGDFDSGEVYEIIGETRLEPSGQIMYTLRSKNGNEFQATDAEISPTNGPVMSEFNSDK